MSNKNLKIEQVSYSYHTTVHIVSCVIYGVIEWPNLAGDRCGRPWPLYCTYSVNFPQSEFIFNTIPYHIWITTQFMIVWKVTFHFKTRTGFKIAFDYWPLPLEVSIHLTKRCLDGKLFRIIWSHLLTATWYFNFMDKIRRIYYFDQFQFELVW